MDAQLAQRFEALEERRRAMVDRVRALPADRQIAKPSNGTFTPAELIHHMALSEKASVERMRRLPPAALKGKKPKTTFIYKKVVGDMNNAKPISAPPNMRPSPGVSLDDAANQWEQHRKDIAAYLDEAGSSEAPVQKFLLFGTMSASDLLALLEAHHHYHETRFPQV